MGRGKRGSLCIRDRRVGEGGQGRGRIEGHGCAGRPYHRKNGGHKANAGGQDPPKAPMIAAMIRVLVAELFFSVMGNS